MTHNEVKLLSSDKVDVEVGIPNCADAPDANTAAATMAEFFILTDGIVLKSLSRSKGVPMKSRDLRSMRRFLHSSCAIYV